MWRCATAVIASLLLAACSDEPATGSGGGGTAGSGGTPAGPGSGGATTTGAATGGADGGGGAAAPSCASANVVLCEDFEDTADGEFPAEWGARGDEWGAGVLGVASGDAMRGRKSLKAVGGNNGQHFMDYKGALGALASHHWGRVFMKVATPAPWPSSGVLHADFIEGLGPGPGGSTHNVRWGVVENTQMMFQWIYNVQPSNGDPEFAEGTSYVYSWTGEWQCIEWLYDEPSQHGELWIDGEMLPIVPGAGHAAEIPVFTSLGVGLANYQDAGQGFTVWFDALAYDDERIGCDE